LKISRSIGEQWNQLIQRDKFHDWEIYPTAIWKYGLMAEAEYEVLKAPIPQQPFDASQTPIRLKTKGQQVINWRMEGNNADAPPLNPTVEGQPLQDLTLVPYGSARLRIGEFPLIGKRSR
jgi:hypothetical protein